MKLFPIIAILAITCGSSLESAVLVRLDPQTSNAAQGGSTAVKLLISGLGSDTAPSLGAFDFDLTFDPTIVKFTGLAFGDPVLGDQLDLSGKGSISDFSLQSPGVLDFYEISLDSAAVLDSQQAGQFVLATFQFQAIGKGSTSLVTSVNSVSDSEGSPLAVQLQSGSINVVPVPEPNALWVFPLTVAGLALWGKLPMRLSRAGK